VEYRNSTIKIRSSKKKKKRADSFCGKNRLALQYTGALWHANKIRCRLRLVVPESYLRPYEFLLLDSKMRAFRMT